MASTNLSLQPYSREAGLELLIDTETGAVYASQRALARMCEKDERTIRRWKGAAQIEAISAEVPTEGGFQGAALYDESAIKRAILRYNPTLAEKMLDAGLRVFLYGMAGYQVKPQMPEAIAQDAKPAIDYIAQGCAAAARFFGEAYAESMFAQNMRRHHPSLALPPVPAKERSSLPSTEALLIPRDIAKELGLMNGAGSPDSRAANALLKQLGYQESIAGQWQPTEKGQAFCTRKPVDTNSRTEKTQLLWYSSILKELKPLPVGCLS
jgi:hypothetical protein